MLEDINRKFLGYKERLDNINILEYFKDNYGIDIEILLERLEKLERKEKEGVNRNL